MDIKPTLDKPTKKGGEIDKKFDSFITEIDSTLSEGEKKKKEVLFNLAKMEFLVHNDPDLSEYYHDMVDEKKDFYGYHFNEAIMNIIFNTKVLKNKKYLRRYISAPIKKKSRRDKYGVEDLKTPETKKREEKDKKEETNETTSASGSGQYSSAFAWSADGKPKNNKPAWDGGKVIQEHSDYLTNPELFKMYFKSINEGFENEINEDHLQGKEEKIIFIVKNKGDEYGDLEKLDSMTDEEINKIYDEVESDKGVNEEIVAEHHIDDKDERIKFIIDNVGDKYGDENMLRNLNDAAVELIYLGVERDMGIDDINPDDLDEFDVDESDDINEASKSKSQQRFMGMVRGVQKGEIDPNDVGDSVAKAAENMKKNDVKDFAATKHDELPEKVEESSILEPLDDTMGMSNDRQDSMKLSKPMTNSEIGGITEERRTSSLIQVDKIKKENENNFKNDVQKIKGLDFAKDQQIDIDDAKQFSNEIEKQMLKNTKGIAYKNVGDSTNIKGDEIPKRNQTDDEIAEIDMMRDGMHTLAYDSKPNKRFEERMENDMGEYLYKIRQNKMKVRSQENMYNKDEQPINDDSKRMNKYIDNISETTITGKYYDRFGDKKIIDFKMKNVTNVDNIDESYIIIDIEGMGNFYNKNFDLNESTLDILKNKTFYINESLNKIVVSNKKEKNIKLNENPQIDKMRKLFNFNPQDFIDSTTSKNAIN